MPRGKWLLTDSGTLEHNPIFGCIDLHLFLYTCLRVSVKKIPSLIFKSAAAIQVTLLSPNASHLFSSPLSLQLVHRGRLGRPATACAVARMEAHVTL